jgi:hypothetical protein
MTAPELAAEMKALRESVEMLRIAVQELTTVFRTEEVPRDAAAAGFERYRARLKAREART